MMEMRRRGHTDELIREIVFENPKRFLSQSPKFQLKRGVRERELVGLD
jgi:hypothetical protein